MAKLLLGRAVAAEQGTTGDDVTVATEDLVTHGVIVGMTGSGKTGLGIGLIEEVLAAGVPTLLIDPKGDLTNLALVFPSLAGPEFEPWVDPAQAKAAGVSTAEFAAGQAEIWRTGLAGWGIDSAALQAFKDSFDVTIYTPGSTAGVPLNILGSLAAPVGADGEVVADEIEGYVTSLLSLVGIDADPLASREHILLSNIIAAAWANNETIDLPTLLGRVQQPPMRKLGVFELDAFFPPPDRMKFAMKLNGVLAAPGFATWISGDPVDISAMLYTPDGRPRCAIITTAHLSDEQRQSATALILGKLITWMRRQSGTTDLRAMLYMDEVAGYLPPSGNPPTKKPIMLLMKQARAFGLGVVLSTQNPVDVDYKAMSNAGTWLVGRLSTEQDKARLLDGMTDAAGEVDKATVGAAISGLGKRQFLLRKAGTNAVVPFGTKWARSYLRGPMTREQISAVMTDLGSPAGGQAPQVEAGAPSTAPAPPSATEAPAAELADDETQVMPQVAADVPVAFLDPAAVWSSQIGAVPLTAAGPRLEAAAVARVIVRYNDARADLMHEEEYEAVLSPLPANTAAVAPLAVDYDDRDLLAEAPPAARYVVPEAKIANKTYWTTLKRDLTDYLVRSKPLEIMVNTDLKAYSRPGESPDEFAARCAELAGAEADKKTAALQTKYESKLRTLRTQLDSAAARADAAAAARTSGLLTEAGSLFGGFLGGRKSASSLAASARRASAANSRASEAAAKVDELSAKVADLEAQFADEVAVIATEWQAKAEAVTTKSVAPKKTDVRLLDLRLVWVPLG